MASDPRRVEALPGVEITAARQPEMQALVRHLGRTAPESELIGLRSLADNIEAAVIEIETGAPQRPVYPILPRERLLIAFHHDGHPVVAPLRPEFPSTPHSDFVGADGPLPVERSLCLDDRPWVDAKADYSAAELLRRIAAWFGRAASGEMDDPLQVPEPVFRPAPISVVMPPDGLQHLAIIDEAGPRFLVICGDTGAKVYRGQWLVEAPQPSEGCEWSVHLVIPIGSRTEGEAGGWGMLPASLGQMERAWGEGGDLYPFLQDHLAAMWDRAGDDTEQFLKSRPMLVWLNIDERLGIQRIGLIPHDLTTAELLAHLGLAWPPDGDARYHARRVPRGEIESGALDRTPLIPANLYRPFDFEVAQALSGQPAMARSVVVLGAGAIGSQIAELLSREGAWERVTIVDHDHLLPHNLSRHLLTADGIGNDKAGTMAARLSGILPGIACGIAERFSSAPSPELREVLDGADLLLDLAASTGTSRALADDPASARRACAFFNPQGDAVVVMAEDRTREIDLGLLEALYYGEVLGRPELDRHLRPAGDRIFVAGSCRDLTSRIPASRAALLSAAAANALHETLAREEAGLRILTLTPDGLSTVRAPSVGGCRTETADGWTIRLPHPVEQGLQAAREASLPSETGGVLLGIVDHARKRIEIAGSLPAPTDSAGSPRLFERGIAGLEDAIADASLRTAFQIDYVGEWHSHPGPSATPSAIDRDTFSRLRRDAALEDRPAVMAILADREVTLLVGAA